MNATIPKAKIIWVADDTPLLQEVMTQMLEQKGATVRIFTDPYKLTAALRAAPAGQRPDLIITDYNFSPAVSPMVVARGDDIHTNVSGGAGTVIELVREGRMGIPVIIFTGVERDSIPQSESRAQDVTVVSKPGIDALMDMVDSKLSAARGLR